MLHLQRKGSKLKWLVLESGVRAVRWSVTLNVC